MTMHRDINGSHKRRYYIWLPNVCSVKWMRFNLGCSESLTEKFDFKNSEGSELISQSAKVYDHQWQENIMMRIGWKSQARKL